MVRLVQSRYPSHNCDGTITVNYNLAEMGDEPEIEYVSLILCKHSGERDED